MAEQKQKGKRLEILIVDSDATFGPFLTGYLEEEPEHNFVCSVFIRARGPQEKLKDKNYDLSVVDTFVEGSGDLLKALKEKGVKIITTSAYNSEEDLERRGFKKGEHYHLHFQKPFYYSDFKEKLFRLISESVPA